MPCWAVTGALIIIAKTCWSPSPYGSRGSHRTSTVQGPHVIKARATAAAAHGENESFSKFLFLHYNCCIWRMSQKLSRENLNNYKLKQSLHQLQPIAQLPPPAPQSSNKYIAGCSFIHCCRLTLLSWLWRNISTVHQLQRFLSRCGEVSPGFAGLSAQILLFSPAIFYFSFSRSLYGCVSVSSFCHSCCSQEMSPTKIFVLLFVLVSASGKNITKKKACPFYFCLHPNGEKYRTLSFSRSSLVLDGKNCQRKHSVAEESLSLLSVPKNRPRSSHKNIGKPFLVEQFWVLLHVCYLENPLESLQLLKGSAKLKMKYFLTLVSDHPPFHNTFSLLSGGRHFLQALSFPYH